jgi:hypothetical protein
MATDYKSQAIAHDLASRLGERGLTSLGIVESFDTDGNPLINIGAGSAGGANAVIKCLPVVWPLAQDVLGLSANMYSPHTLQLVTEADPTAGSGADPLSPNQLMMILGQVQQMGTIVEWYQTAAGTPPTAAGITSGNLQSTFYPDQRYPLISGQ